MDVDEAWLEATLAFGSMKIIGKEHAIPDLKNLKDRYAEKEGKDLPEFLKEIQRYGMVGYHFSHELQHQPPRSGLDPEIGVDLLERIAMDLLPVIDHLKRYVDYVSEPFSFLEPD